MFLLCLCNLFWPKKSIYRNDCLCHCHNQTGKPFHPLKYFDQWKHKNHVKTFMKPKNRNVLLFKEISYDFGQSSIISIWSLMMIEYIFSKNIEKSLFGLKDLQWLKTKSDTLPGRSAVRYFNIYTKCVSEWSQALRRVSF